MITEVKSDAELRNAIDGAGLRVLYFCADWCGPCKAFAPLLGRVATEMKDVVTFVKAKVEDCPEETVRMAVWSVPTLVAFKDGVAIDTRKGAQSQASFTTWLASLA